MVQLNSAPGSFKKPEVQKPKAEETKQEAVAEKNITEEAVEDIEAKTEDYFAKLGIKFTEEDFTKLLFNGSYEATLEIRPGLKVSLRTLQASDYNEVDEKLAQMTKDVAMTDEGYRSRFTLLTLSYGLLKVNGKDLVSVKNQKGKDGPSDTELSDLRYGMLSKMAPAIINAISAKHNALTMAINTVVGDSQYHLKNS
jgi:hypothetical protein